jgi:hypothetical protein
MICILSDSGKKILHHIEGKNYLLLHLIQGYDYEKNPHHYFNCVHT